MRKIFIDCGAHNGSSVAYFREVFEDAGEYEIYSFEPNPSLSRYWPISGVNLIDSAVWIEDGETTFYEKVKPWKNSTETPPESSTLMHSKVNYQQNTPENRRAYLSKKATFNEIKVKTIDINRWIKENFEKDDYIVLKVDIECAEYEVFKHMFSENTLDYINEIFGELHSLRCGKLESQAKDDDKMIYEGLKKYGLEMYYWDANDSHGPRTQIYTDPYENKDWPSPQLVLKKEKEI